MLSRVNGEWDVQSILKLCPMGEEEAMLHLRPPARAEADQAVLSKGGAGAAPP